LSGTGLCDDLITRLEESYRLWYVVLCDIENLKNEDGMTRVGSQNHKKCSYVNVKSHLNTFRMKWPLKQSKLKWFGVVLC